MAEISEIPVAAMIFIDRRQFFSQLQGGTPTRNSVQTAVAHCDVLLECI
ncbi:hypothetical protein [Burkholderia pyrrocinia]|nr:hypothetical protein [Burkholderia pyrrocinia]